MKRIGLCIGLLISVLCFGQDLEHTLLWKVKKDGSKETYLFGTLHVLPRNDFELDEKVKDALYGSDELVMEMDMSDPTLQNRMMQLAAMDGEMTIDRLLSEEDYALLDRKLQSTTGMSLAGLNTFKPFMISTFLLREYVGSQPASFELALMSMASNREMPISGLESIELQMAVFDSIPYEDQMEDVMEMVKDSVEMADLFRSMIDTYKAEDLSGLYKTTESYFGSEVEMRYLLYKRNKNWVEVLTDLMGEKTLFVAVGAAHLAGDQGLIRLLREEGYEVEPVFD